MAAAVAQLLLLLVLTLLCLTVTVATARSTSSSYRCDWCRRRRSGTTASILHPGVATGTACGYGTPAAATSAASAGGGFYFAAANAEFFRHGQAACGTCYQLRCRDRSACRKDGVKVVITNDIRTNRTAAGSGGRFMLPRDAFAAMAAAVHGDDDDVRLQQLVLDVDFRRIPCDLHKDRTLAVRVEETSVRARGRLALRFLFQGGQTDIAAVEVAAAASSSNFSWRYLTRETSQGGVVWSTARAPAGPLRLRVVVTAGSGGKWLRAEREVLPAEWIPGGVYDTGLRVTDVAMSTCSCSSAGDDDEGREEEEFR